MEVPVVTKVIEAVERRVEVPVHDRVIETVERRIEVPDGPLVSQTMDCLPAFSAAGAKFPKNAAAYGMQVSNRTPFCEALGSKGHLSSSHCLPPPHFAGCFPSNSSFAPREAGSGVPASHFRDTFRGPAPPRSSAFNPSFWGTGRSTQRPAPAPPNMLSVRPALLETIKVLEVPTERVVTIDRVVEKPVPVTIPSIEVVEKRVEVPVIQERVVEVQVEATGMCNGLGACPLAGGGCVSPGVWMNQ